MKSLCVVSIPSFDAFSAQQAQKPQGYASLLTNSLTREKTRDTSLSLIWDQIDDEYHLLAYEWLT